MDIIIPDTFFTPEQRKRYYDAMGMRRSIRTYLGAPDESILQRLASDAKTNTFPGVRLQIISCDDKLFTPAPGIGSIIGCRVCAAVIYDKTQMNALLYAGMAGEAFVLNAVSMGLGTCWVGGTYHKRRLKQVKTGVRERITAIIAFGIPAEDDPQPRKRKNMTAICRGNAAAWPIWAYHAAECVRTAPSAMNRQPWKMAYAGRTLLLMRGLLADKLSLGIALLHMTLGLESKPHRMTFSTGREVAALIAEDRT